MQTIGKSYLTIFCLLCLALLAFLSPGAAIAADMEVPAAAGSCGRCHNYNEHAMNNCDLCHDKAASEAAASLAGGHGGLVLADATKTKAAAPVGNCRECHGYTDSYTDVCKNCHPSWWAAYGYQPRPLTVDPAAPWGSGYSHDATRINNYEGIDTTYSCEGCHIQSWWTSINNIGTGALLESPHNSANFGTADQHMSDLQADCQECHDIALTREHVKEGRTDPAKNPINCFTCHENVNSQVQLAITNGDTRCDACHSQAHAYTAGMPEWLPLYPGPTPEIKLDWTTPMPWSLWKGEAWVWANPGDIQLIMSNRAKLNGDNVWAFYNNTLTSQGWVINSNTPAPVPGSTYFRVRFDKGSNMIIVRLTPGEDHAGKSVPTGTRIELAYK